MMNDTSAGGTRQSLAGNPKFSPAVRALEAMMDIKRIKRINSHVGLSRYLDTTRDTNQVTPRVREIPSPYAYSPTHTVYQDTEDRLVIVVETAHKRYDVFDVSAGFPMLEESAA
jgi:hypothetical protein